MRPRLKNSMVQPMIDARIFSGNRIWFERDQPVDERLDIRTLPGREEAPRFA